MVAIRISNSLKALRGATRARPAPQTYRAFATTLPRFYAQGYGDGDGHPQGEDPQNQPGATKAQSSLEHPGPEPPDVGKGTGAGPTKAASKKSKKVGSSPEDASAQSGGSRSKEATETGSSPTGGDIASGESQHGGGGGGGGGSSSSGSAGFGAGSTTGGTPKDTSTANAASQRGGEGLKGPQGEGTPSPKILNQSVPGDKKGLNKEQKQEVEQHNKDFEKRYDRGSEAPDDKVDKNYWSGQ